MTIFPVMSQSHRPGGQSSYDTMTSHERAVHWQLSEQECGDFGEGDDFSDTIPLDDEDLSSGSGQGHPFANQHQRMAANMRERRRMQSINDAFEVLFYYHVYNL